MEGVRGAAALFFVALMVPFAASAQVVIDEIMYNPQGADTDNEWIELHNQGDSDVSIIGGTVNGSWRISTGSNHTITDPSGGVGRGSLTVPAGGYLVLASDPDTFLAENLSGAYSVAKSSLSLSNTASTIALIDGSGTTVDSVSYTKDQGASDDGSSLQKQSDGTWVAAQPTPGAANSATPYVAPSADDTDQSPSDQNTSDQTSSTTQQTSQTQTTKTTIIPSYVVPPVPSIFAEAGADRTVIVGADVEFDASAYDKNSDPISANVRFSWNFGDGSTAEGAAVLHHFSYPGKYLVVLTIAENRSAGSDEIVVTAEPAAISFTLLHDGGVAIGNNAGHDLDLSGWVIKQSASSFAAQFILPQHSLVLAGSSMQISNATLGFKASPSSGLEYPNGAPALGVGNSSPSIQKTVTRPATISAAGQVVPVVHAIQVSRSAPRPASAAAPKTSADSASDVIATSSQTGAAAKAVPRGGYLWWLVALGLALAVGIVIVALKQVAQGEWEIVEETRD